MILSWHKFHLGPARGPISNALFVNPHRASKGISLCAKGMFEGSQICPYFLFPEMQGYAAHPYSVTRMEIILPSPIIQG
jgi:hypothetical protein